MQDVFEKEFYVAIDNRDNPPLEFSKIELSQTMPMLVADLKAGQKYTLQTGNPKLSALDYDLSSFNPKLFDSLPEARLTQIEHFKAPEKTPGEKSLWQQAWFLWLCIGIGGLAILYFTVSLIKDMK